MNLTFWRRAQKNNITLDKVKLDVPPNKSINLQYLSVIVRPCLTMRRSGSWWCWWCPSRSHCWFVHVCFTHYPHRLHPRQCFLLRHADKRGGLPFRFNHKCKPILPGYASDSLARKKSGEVHCIGKPRARWIGVPKNCVCVLFYAIPLLLPFPVPLYR